MQGEEIDEEGENCWNVGKDRKNDKGDKEERWRQREMERWRLMVWNESDGKIKTNRCRETREREKRKICKDGREGGKQLVVWKDCDGEK